MKVSIITSCFNSASTLEGTIKSVLSQDFPDIEYIVVDGKSSDATSEIIHKYKGQISNYLSEPDTGIYDALNKGIRLATGEVIGILHSDDFYQHAQVISNLVKRMSETNSDCVYADLVYVDRVDPMRTVRYWRSGEYCQGLFLTGWMPPHPTFFIKKRCYDEFGSFSTVLRTSADYELMLRMMHKHRIKASYLPEVVVRMRTGGMSNSSLAHRLKANREDKLAWKLNGIRPGFFTLVRKPLSKISQYFTRSSS